MKHIHFHHPVRYTVEIKGDLFVRRFIFFTSLEKVSFSCTGEEKILVTKAYMFYELVLVLHLFHVKKPL